MKIVPNAQKNELVQFLKSRNQFSKTKKQKKKFKYLELKFLS